MATGSSVENWQDLQHRWLIWRFIPDLRLWRGETVEKEGKFGGLVFVKRMNDYGNFLELPQRQDDLLVVCGDVSVVQRKYFNYINK
ncbi:hypothetical protein PsorP6_004269 [Peronosclerospora sorghi]|uniref:Uncharacterized protein n=1 Tax=Peronosclerospora sorghi TaxID=230839 RepID=A0ACC0VN28_9STRA|nr:hypothetical protein PsorP6_004269 [Peronosclerospora sorghi]